MVDLLRHALVPAAVEVDLTGGTDHDADRREGPRPGDPELWRSGHVADVGLPAEHQDVEVERLHLGHCACAPPCSQGQAVGDDLVGHQMPAPYGA